MLLKRYPLSFFMVAKRDVQRGSNALLQLHSYTYNMYNRLITCFASFEKGAERRL